jgi:hypothetical protein
LTALLQVAGVLGLQRFQRSFFRKVLTEKNIHKKYEGRCQVTSLKKTTSHPSFQRSHQTQQLLLCSDYLLGSSADAFISYFRPVFNFPL